MLRLKLHIRVKSCLRDLAIRLRKRSGTTRDRREDQNHSNLHGTASEPKSAK
jgi:hypothetical protein